MADLDYESDIAIDETALDVEWLEQARLFVRYAQQATRLRAEADKAKERLEVVRAELDRDIRSDPEAFEVAKITEAVVQQTIVLQDRFRKAQAELIDAQSESNFARYAVEAMQQRKDALENLVRLHGQQYFAGPRVPRDLGNEMAARRAKQKRVDAGVRAKMAKKDDEPVRRRK